MEGEPTSLKLKASKELTSTTAKKAKEISESDSESDSVVAVPSGSANFSVAHPVQDIFGLEYVQIASDGNCGFRVLAGGYPEFGGENNWLEVRRRMAEYFAAHQNLYMGDAWSSFRLKDSKVPKHLDSMYTFCQLYNHLYSRFKRNPRAGSNPVT